MDVNFKTVKKLLDASQEMFCIPYFQRSYVWKKENWDAWLETIYSSYLNGKEAFVGSVILKTLETGKQGKAKKFSVIDGQQRLTTTFIFLKSCLAINEELKDKFEGYIKCDDDGVKNAFKLESSRTDEKIFKNIMNSSNPLEIEYISDNSSLKNLDDVMPFVLGEKNTRRKYLKPHILLQAYWYFYNILKRGCVDSDIAFKNPTSLAKDLFYVLVDSLSLICIELDEHEDEQKIFDTINSLGVHLTSAEILKNDIFSKYSKIIRQENDLTYHTDDLYKDYWKSVFEEDKDTIDFWDKELIIGRLSKNMLDILLHSFLIAQVKPEKNYIKHEDLLGEYKKYLKDFSTKTSILDLLKEIKSYAEAFRYLFNYNETFGFNDWKSRFMTLVDRLDTKSLYPLLTFLVKNHNTKDEHALKNLEYIFKILECFIVRRHLNQDDEKSYTRLFTSWIKKLSECENITLWANVLQNEILAKEHQEKTSRAYPTDKQILTISNKEYHTKYKAMVAILFVIELHRRRDERNMIRDLYFSPNLSLEHIIPQKYEDNWKDVIQNEEEGIYVHNIGNFTVVNTPLNSSLRNADWAGEKGKLKKYEEYAKDWKINSTIITPKKPTIQILLKRADELASAVIDIWSFIPIN